MADEQKGLGDATEAVEASATQITTEVQEAVQSAVQGDFSSTLGLAEHYLLPIGSAILFLIVGYMLARFLARVASAPVQRRVDETVGRFVSKLIFYSVMAFVLLGILGSFGISVASFAAVVAAAGFAVGLAFQGTLSNFAAGILLLVFRPFKIGDLITAAGITGIVDEIDLFTTTFNTLDNRRIIVPNSNISGSVIENITHHPQRRVDVSVGVEYAAEINKTREVLTKAAESLEQFKVANGFEVFLSELGDSSVNWQVRYWAKTENYWDVWQQLTESIKVELDRAGLGIPFPQMDVHFDRKTDQPLLKVAGD